MRTDIRVFEINDCDWCAASSLEEAVAYYGEYMGLSGNELAEATEHARELSDKDMREHHFHDLDDGGYFLAERTYAKQLSKLIADGAVFPCFFATREC